MFEVKQLRRLLEARVNEAGDQRKGRQRFVKEIHESLGVTRDGFGRATIKPGSASPYEYSIPKLAKAIGGDRFIEYLCSDHSTTNLTLREAAVDATTFANINTLTLAVGGLIDAAVIERFQNPQFIGDQLVTVRPTTKNGGERLVGIAGIGDKAQTRKPGEPHARTQFGETWISTPALEEKALAVEVTQEVFEDDITGQILDVAGSIGDELGYSREKTIIDLSIGVNNPYVYENNPYDTYATVGDGYAWVNSQTNEFSDENDIDEAIQLFNEMTDPKTGKEILVMANTILCAPSRQKDFMRSMNATEIRNTTNSTFVTIAPPNREAQQFNLLTSPILYNRMRNADGLNLGDTNAKKRWFIGDFKKAFLWMERRPVGVKQASASEYKMIDHGILAAYFANYKGIGAVKEPRHVAENTH